MASRGYSLILSTALRCNADCDYCFQDNTGERMSIKQVGHILAKYSDYLVRRGLDRGGIYWTGGDIMARNPDWLRAAIELKEKVERNKGLSVDQYLQSNLLGYHEGWNPLILEKLGAGIGSSLDYPNLYRRVRGSAPSGYNEIWFRKYRRASESGIHVRAISLINSGTLKVGAREFYAYMVEHIGLRALYVQPIFPSARIGAAEEGILSHPDLLGRFLADLIDVWIEKGREHIEIEPFGQMLRYFETGTLENPTCVWNPGCADQYLAIDPNGNVSPCDCFTTRHPRARYGNIFACDTLEQLVAHEFHARLLHRPMELIENQACGECEYLALCHGGCAVHAYTFTGNLYARDPYCASYRIMFGHLRKRAVELARQKCRPATSAEA